MKKLTPDDAWKTIDETLIVAGCGIIAAFSLVVLVGVMLAK